MGSAGRSRPRPSAGVSQLVAPVPPIRLDQVGREDFAGVESDDIDLLLVDDGEDPPAGEGRPDLEVVQAARPPQGHGTLAVGDVVAEAEVAPCAGAGRQRPGCGPVRLAGRGPADRPVWPLLVVGEAEGVELSLQPGEVGGRRLLPEPTLEGLVEALDLALGLRVAGRTVLDG